MPTLFGLSKLWSYLIYAAILIAVIAGMYFFVFNKGVNHAEKQVEKANVEVLDTARAADDKAIVTVLQGTRTIEIRTHEIKEVIHEVPDTSLNPVSRARLERVRQQQAESEAGSDADSGSVSVSGGTESTSNGQSTGL